VLAAGCGGGLRTFPIEDPTWVDPDKRSFNQEPEEYFSSFFWDGADNMVFRPFAKFWKVDPAGEAPNVNSMDEVPDSAWFTNRIGRRKMSLEEAAKGPCYGKPPLDPAGPWTVTGAKPNGANPGFPIKDRLGRRFMVKFDGVVQGPRATSADVVGSKIYHAAGFEAPCNQVVLFDRSILSISPKAKAKNHKGEKVPVTEKDLDTVFSKAIRLPDGRYRGSSSLFVRGKPIGPFRYEETRDDDPNDVIPHEDRRDLRGSKILAAWTNHFDSREQNSLDAWIETSEGSGYIQHYFIDWGDCFGSVWEPPMMGRRVGHSNYMSPGHIMADWLSFGLITRPWDTNRFGPTKAVLGYYDVDNFEPAEYHPGYPNPAMLRMTERDGAWMARILARITPAHVHAMLGEAKIQDPAIFAELERVVLGRRVKLLARYLTRVSPLTDPEVIVTGGGKAELCMEDLAVTANVVSPQHRSYRARAWVTTDLEAAPVPNVRTPSLVCAQLPAAPGASEATPQYVIVDVFAQTGSEDRVPARVHLYHLGGTNYRVVGLQRPYDAKPPEG